jgi:WD40 repeat protein
MDGTHCVLDINHPEGKELVKFEQHTKYVVKAKWHPDGNFFATGSYDKSVCVYRYH